MFLIGGVSSLAKMRRAGIGRQVTPGTAGADFAVDQMARRHQPIG
jgi:hypothetical protein